MRWRVLIPKIPPVSNKPVPDYTAQLNDSLAGKTIGLPKEYFEKGLDSDVAKCIDEAITVYRKIGRQNLKRSLYLPAHCLFQCIMSLQC